MKLSDNEISEAAGGPTKPFTPGKGALSTLFRWFADESKLCVVATDLTMKPPSADIGFAHALGHLGDRDLIVVFPKSGAEAVSHRLPFLDLPARCFALTGDGVELIEPKRPADVVALYKGTRGGTHDVSVGLTLAAPVVSWLAERKGAVQDDRKSYRTWQYKGRQVLTLRMAGSVEAELVAGVNYSNPKPGLEPVVLRLAVPITDAELVLVKTAINTACKGRDSGARQRSACTSGPSSVPSRPNQERTQWPPSTRWMPESLERSKLQTASSRIPARLPATNHRAGPRSTPL